MDKSRELGMRTFDWALFELYDQGHIRTKKRCATPTPPTNCAWP
jgi:Tfp pilus assembly ATPase PilU